ncbi:MAG: hypothetical protein PCALPYG88_6392 [uncultured Paraburkholderia sp.]|uniref:hypothetical protein n=1 Tax=uncultured Paraburkholderia sp. TaxID=1822466 RepID=UPI002595C4B4|nr:hypothetical protein [uncultured Paraburkholderia sp.]CAH2903144.1 MAG: hypothetical protein PCALPYG08_6522 [uncultured Paraburkholderia sp.]CAH2938863.1 MAG: hypothetical protein PCALPYG88_6392 [uncultured Paraburkholderia sp.]
MNENFPVMLLQAFTTGCACALLLGGCSTARFVSDDYSAEFQGRYVVSDTTGDDAMKNKTIDLAFGEGRTATVVVEESHRVFHLDACRSLAGSFANSLANATSDSIIHAIGCLDEDDRYWSFMHGRPGAKTSAGYTLFRNVTSQSGYLVRRSVRDRYPSDLALEPLAK